MRFQLAAAASIAALGALLAGCESPSYPESVPQTTWVASPPSARRTAQPRDPYRNVEPVRAPVQNGALTKERVLDLATRRDPQEAISEIDRHPLAFPLNEDTIGWFEDRLVAPEVVDYLRKRAAVDWSALRRDSGPAYPAPSYGQVPQQQDDFAPLPSETPPRTVVVDPQPQTTVVYDYTTYDPYPYYYGGWWGGPGYYYYYPYYRRDWDHDHRGAYYYGSYHGGGGTVYYGGVTRRNPVVVAAPGTVTTYPAYRQGPVVSGGGAPPAGVYNPQGFQGGTTRSGTRSGGGWHGGGSQGGWGGGHHRR